MKKKFFLILFFNLIFIFSFNSIFSAEKIKFVLNPGLEDSNKFFVNWHREHTWRDIYNWSRTQGIELLPENGPIIDNKAYFVSQFGSKVKIIDSRLRNMHQAKLLIDFVSFRNYSKNKVPSLLKITMKNLDTGYTVDQNIRFEDLTGKPYEIKIPYELLSHGKFEILFREYSISIGKWGIWDMMLFN